MDVPAPLTGQQRARLASIRQREDDTFRTRVPKSLALGMRARELVPSGVPMAWMAGYYRCCRRDRCLTHPAGGQDLPAHRDARAPACRAQCLAEGFRGRV
jgi:hypothetical protein